MSAFMEHATPAQTVSNQFVSQFYTVLHTSPRNLHRFYSEASTLTLADTRPDGQHIVKTVTGQKSIHETVMNQGLEDTVTEVYSVDSQYSLNGGVVVQVTGTQSSKGGPKRPFVQTFFLAVQEKGFYVMNDMFRFLPDFRLLFGVENGYPAAPLMPQVPKTNGIAMPPPAGAAMPMPAAPPMMPPAALPTPIPVVPGQLPPAAVPVPQPLPPPPMPMPVPTPPPAVVPPPPPAAAMVPPAPPAAPIPQQAVQPPQPPVQQPAQAPQQQEPPQPPSPPAPRPIATNAPKAASEPGAPLSYAERLKQGRSSVPSSPTKHASAPAPPVPAPAVAPAAAPTVPAAAPVLRAPEPPVPAAPAAAAAAPAGGPAPGGIERSASQSGLDAGGFAVDGPPGSSVFVKDIPPAITMEELEEQLSQFGPLRPNGVNLKTQRGKDSYAFVDFETVEAAQACMERGLDFGGHHVKVVEKLPRIFRGGMRIRGGPPTGYSGRGDRGSYRGGRGGRGPYPGAPPMMMADGGRGGMGGRMGPMGGPVPPMRGGGRGRFDERGRGRGPRPPMGPMV